MSDGNRASLSAALATLLVALGGMWAVLEVRDCRRSTAPVAVTADAPPLSAPPAHAPPPVVCTHEVCGERPTRLRCEDSSPCTRWRIDYEHHCDCDAWGPAPTEGGTK